MTGFLIGAWVATFCIVLAALRRLEGTTHLDVEPVRYVQAEDVLVTPQGVEIPVAWLARPDDLDDVLATLHEIDQLGTGATA